jgi:hypothetical protein
MSKPQFSDDEERRPLLTEEELRDACLHNAATIVVAFLFGCEFEHCWLNDDGYKWPLRLSSVELKYPPNPSLACIASIHEAGAMAVAKRHGRGPCRINRYNGDSETAQLLDHPLTWKVIETLAQFIEDSDQGGGCYGVVGTVRNVLTAGTGNMTEVIYSDPNLNALKLIQEMGLTRDALDDR